MLLLNLAGEFPVLAICCIVPVPSFTAAILRTALDTAAPDKAIVRKTAVRSVVLRGRAARPDLFALRVVLAKNLASQGACACS